MANVSSCHRGVHGVSFFPFLALSVILLNQHRSAMFGYDSAFIGGTLALPSFKSTFGLANSASSDATALSAHIVSTFQAGCFFGALFVLPITEKIGRKWSLVIAGVIFELGAIIQVASQGRIGMLYGGRVLTGLGVGSSSLLVPVYISESAPRAIRGRLVGIFEICLQVALVIGFWINYGVQQNVPSSSNSQWLIPMGFQLVPGGLLIIGMIFMIESPRWLLKKGRTDNAVKSLSWVRNLPGDHPFIQGEVAEIQAQLEHERILGGGSSYYQRLREIMKPGVRNRLFIGCALMWLQNLTGINAINYYSPTIFSSIGFKGTSVSLLATGVYGIVKCCATIIYMILLVDRFGRRRPLMIGSVGAGIAMFYLGAYSKLSHSFDGNATKDGGAYVAIVFIFIYTVFYAMSWNGIPWIFCAEVYPTAVRTLCLVFTTCNQWLAQFVIAYSFPFMIANITYGAFFFFAACIVVAFVFTYLLVPETKGISMEMMDLLFAPEVGHFAPKMRKRFEQIRKARPTGYIAPEEVDFEKGATHHAENVTNVQSTV